MERQRNGNGTVMERQRNGNGTVMERQWNGNGTATGRQRNGNGTVMERQWNGNATVTERHWNGDEWTLRMRSPTSNSQLLAPSASLTYGYSFPYTRLQAPSHAVTGSLTHGHRLPYIRLQLVAPSADFFFKLGREPPGRALVHKGFQAALVCM